MLQPHHIFDGHNDAITRYTSSDEDWTFLTRSTSGHLDLPRALEGGFVGGFFAIFPGIEPGTWFPRSKSFHRDEDGGFHVDLAPRLPTAVAFETSRQMVARAHATAAASDGRIRVANTRSELLDSLSAGSMTVVIHFEGAEALGANLEHFEHFVSRGLRSVGPVWSRPNDFGHGVPFAYPAGPDIGPGLTDAGFELVRACDANGLVVDLAHMNEKGFWDVARTTSRPLVVTHAAAHTLSQKPRNLTDRQIDAVGESGGVIGVTFFVGDLTASQNPEPPVPTSRIVEHLLYIADRIGIEHVALGSDFDGAPIPRDMKDAAGLPVLIAEMRRAGLDDDAIAAVAHGNWLRILEDTLPP